MSSANLPEPAGPELAGLELAGPEPASLSEAAPGANRALALSTTAFTVCFAVWTIFAIIGVELKTRLGLSETQFGLLVGTPILTGSLVRVFFGIWTDQFGGRLMFPMTMLASGKASRARWAYTVTARSGRLPASALGV